MFVLGLAENFRLSASAAVGLSWRVTCVGVTKMSEYTPIQDLEYEAPPVITSSSVTNTTTVPTNQTPANALSNSKDGVFKNIKKDKDGLPTYDESLLIVDEAPPYVETAPFSYIEDGDVLFDGVLVGFWSEFITMGIMSFIFDFLGYFLTSLLSTSHAGRCGSKMGLGLTLIRFGIILQDELEKATHKKETENIMSVIFVVVGAFVSSKALSDYMLLRKTRSILRNITQV